ncbi:MAG: enoyl-CoA hydratase-related protein [Thermoanaerobaculia bacterium]|nr:enoyl-CoA hydratase-related protein [Thermoanaerobaculia bacterium]
MPDSDLCLYELRGRTALLTLNRARYRNAQSYPLLDALDEQLDRAMADPEVSVAVVQGAGDHFSSGHDLGTADQRAVLAELGLALGAKMEQGLRYYDVFRHYNLDLTVKWRNLKKPTIAMVRGYCIFGGWMIATAMDLIFASDDARFLASQFEYFSVPWDIHPRKAKELVFESRFLSAEEARAEGLVNRVYGGDELERETLAYAGRVAENDPEVLRLSKLAINKAQDQQGYSVGVEAAFADYLVTAQSRGNARVDGVARLTGVDLALRGERGERPGLTEK